MKADDVFRLLYHILLGCALLILSAVADREGSELSHFLAPRLHQIPEMTQSVAAGMALALFGSLGYSYLRLHK